MTELITFDSIRTIHRAEKGEQLSKLPEGFFSSVAAWLDQKRSMRDPLSLRETETVKIMLDDIINRRQRKLITSAIRTVRGDVPPENMTDDERKFFDQAVVLFKSFKMDITEKINGADFAAEESIEEARRSLEEAKAVAEPEPQPVQEAQPQPVQEPIVPKPAEKPIDPNKMNVRILTDMPKFIGTDLQPYGPFSTGDMVQLPKEIANVLISRKAAQEDMRKYL